MEFRPRTTENDGDLLPTTVDATHEPTRGVTGMYRTESRAHGRVLRPPGLPGLHPARTRSSLETTQSDCWEPRTDHEDLLSQTTFFFFFFGNFYYSIKVLLSLQNLLT